jgi:hypothetical protein
LTGIFAIPIGLKLVAGGSDLGSDSLAAISSGEPLASDTGCRKAIAFLRGNAESVPIARDEHVTDGEIERL